MDSLSLIKFMTCSIPCLSITCGCRFSAISHRSAISEVLRKCSLAAFSRYSQELEDIQSIYERNKVRESGRERARMGG